MSGAIIGSSMAYGLYEADLRHALPLAGWKLVFVILGSITAGVGVLFLVLVPDTVDQARFLTPEERILAIERIRANQQGVIVSQFKPEQVKEALLDPFVSHQSYTHSRPWLIIGQTWLYASVALIASIPNGGVTK
jgi:ACS family allantoate permease-like MFS transporter